MPNKNATMSGDDDKASRAVMALLQHAGAVDEMSTGSAVPFRLDTMPKGFQTSMFSHLSQLNKATADWHRNGGRELNRQRTMYYEHLNAKPRMLNGPSKEAHEQRKEKILKNLRPLVDGKRAATRQEFVEAEERGWGDSYSGSDVED